jgi:hypothetical protein
MLWFEKYGKPKNLIQNQLQFNFKDRNSTPENFRLSLIGNTSRINLSLDATGRVSLPLLKWAYDDNAELVISPKSDSLQFRARVSITPRSDGIYDASELLAACEQVLGFTNFVDATSRGKKCAGVRFVYAKKEQAASAEIRGAKNFTKALTSSVTESIWENSPANLKSFTYLFSNLADKQQIILSSMPLAIVPILE